MNSLLTTLKRLIRDRRQVKWIRDLRWELSWRFRHITWPSLHIMRPRFEIRDRRWIRDLRWELSWRFRHITWPSLHITRPRFEETTKQIDMQQSLYQELLAKLDEQPELPTFLNMSIPVSAFSLSQLLRDMQEGLRAAVFETKELPETANDIPVRAVAAVIDKARAKGLFPAGEATSIPKPSTGPVVSSAMPSIPGRYNQSKLAYRAAQLVPEYMADALRQYWQIQGRFDEIIKQAHSDIEANRAQSETWLLGHLQTLRAEFIGITFDKQEQGWLNQLLGLEEMVRRVVTLPSHPERLSTLGNIIAKLDSLLAEQPESWRVVGENEQRPVQFLQVVLQPNPWRSITQDIRTALENLRRQMRVQLDGLVDGLDSALAEVDSLEIFADVENLLAGYNDPTGGEFFGAMLDSIVREMMSIGGDVLSAMELDAGSPSHALILQGAQFKVNQLRNRLGTRYSTEADRWVAHLQRISEMIDTYFGNETIGANTLYKNPYEIGTPVMAVRSVLFKGRLDITDHILRQLLSGSRPTFVLYGPRRMGKSSFLQQLPRLLSKSRFVPIFINAQDARARQSDGSFFYYLADRVYKQMPRPAGALLTRPERAIYEAQPYGTLEDWLEDEIAPLLESRQLLFMFDEFEILGAEIADPKGGLTTKVLDQLRNMIQYNPNVLFMFCGVETLDALGLEFSSRIINAFPLSISYLSEDAARELITNPDPTQGKMPDYEETTIAEILRLTHGHPFLIQMICSQIVQIAGDRRLFLITPEVLNEAVDKIFGSFYFTEIMDRAKAFEHGVNILQQLAQGQALLSFDLVSSSAVRDMLKRGVIVKQGDGHYEIREPLVKRWLRGQFISPDSPEKTPPAADRNADRATNERAKRPKRTKKNG